MQKLLMTRYQTDAASSSLHPSQGREGENKMTSGGCKICRAPQTHDVETWETLESGLAHASQHLELMMWFWSEAVEEPNEVTPENRPQDPLQTHHLTRCLRW